MDDTVFYFKLLVVLNIFLTCCFCYAIINVKKPFSPYLWEGPTRIIDIFTFICTCLNFVTLMCIYDKAIGALGVMLTIYIPSFQEGSTCSQFSDITKLSWVYFLVNMAVVFVNFNSVVSLLGSVGSWTVWNHVSKSNRVIRAFVLLFLFYCFIFGSLLSSDWSNHYKELLTNIRSENFPITLRFLTSSDWFLQSAFQFERNSRGGLLESFSHLLCAPIQAPDIITVSVAMSSDSCVETFTFYTLCLRLLCTFVFLRGIIVPPKIKKLTRKEIEAIRYGIQESYRPKKNEPRSGILSWPGIFSVSSSKKTKARSRSSGRRRK